MMKNKVQESSRVLSKKKKKILEGVFGLRVYEGEGGEGSLLFFK